MLKIGFIIGHTATEKGAYSKYLGEFEYDFYKNFANEYLRNLGEVFFHEIGYDYKYRQFEIAKRTKDLDLVIELHFNAFNEVANGCEVLTYKGNKTALKLANNFINEYNFLTGVKKRKVIEVDNIFSNGGLFLYYQKPTALILEPFFGDNYNDVLKATKCKKDLFISIKKSIFKTFNI